MDHIQSIRAFVTVVRLGSFTKAARQLSVSLASLSRAVSNLESHTQTRLVSRSSRFVSLAPGAREYFNTCVDVLDRLYEGEQRLLDDRAASRGVLRIAAHPIAIEVGLPEVVREYQRDAPEVEIVLNMRTPPLRLEQDNYDVAIYPPDLILDADAVCRRILNSPILLVASHDYLSSFKLNRTQPDLNGHIILSCQNDTKHERELRLEHAGKITTLSRGSVRMDVGESTAVRLALSGFGMALLPEFLAAPYLANGKLRLAFPDHKLIDEVAALGVAYLRQGTIAHRVRSFVNACTRSFGLDSAADVRQPAGIAA